MDKEKLAKLLKIDEKKLQAAQIEKQMESGDFWVDRENAAKLSQKLSDIKSLIDKFENSNEPRDLEELEKEALYTDEHDDKGAILSIHAGAGGTEAQDWAQMLLRMYLRYGEKMNYSTDVLGESMGEEVGIKSATIKIEGYHAYGNFKSEAGVHRLVRISPFDADKARHTSFALVEIIPIIEEIADVEIPDKDLKIDVFRASGHGGQSVNTTDSAVRITHLPTKTVVSVQNERSQLQNREMAMKILKMKLKKIQLDEKRIRDRELKGERVSAEWGNQIRSYVLQPYQQVKDHRTDFESTNPQEVLDGDLNGFIDAYLRYINNK
jgi:peptide chain release factor 2